MKMGSGRGPGHSQPIRGREHSQLSQWEAGNTGWESTLLGCIQWHYRGLNNMMMMTINNDRSNSNKTRVIIAILSEYHRLDQELRCHKTLMMTWASLWHCEACCWSDGPPLMILLFHTNRIFHTHNRLETASALKQFWIPQMIWSGAHHTNLPLSNNRKLSINLGSGCTNNG